MNPVQQTKNELTQAVYNFKDQCLINGQTGIFSAGVVDSVAKFCDPSEIKWIIKGLMDKI